MERLFENREKWHLWLEENFEKEKEIWIIYYKKHVNKKSLSYEDAVMEALCFGWIDSIVKRIDEEQYKQKFTPRKPKSNWSESNKKRIELLIKTGSMKESGMNAVKRANENRSWDNLMGVDNISIAPQMLLDALSENLQAENNFNNFPLSTKKPETKKRRTREIVKRSQSNIKAGINL